MEYLYTHSLFLHPALAPKPSAASQPPAPLPSFPVHDKDPASQPHDDADRPHTKSEDQEGAGEPADSWEFIDDYFGSGSEREQGSEDAKEPKSAA
ncbi:MAG: hypothetical protein LQ345_003576 [Seirophora villosa]|nr:MAG: hypothetical protein LQ345_003576 [Seirophora villosa]